MMCVYIYIYMILSLICILDIIFYPGRRRTSRAPWAAPGNRTSQEFGICRRACCADSSSPEISAILVGHFRWKVTVSAKFHNSPQNSHHKMCRI